MIETSGVMARVVQQGNGLYICASKPIQEALGIKKGDFVSLLPQGGVVLMAKASVVANIKAAQAAHRKPAAKARA